MLRKIAPIVLLLIVSTAANAETTECINITSLPVVLSSQGVYCLKQDLSTSITSGAAIQITVNNVTLDCNDRKIGGLAGGITTNAYGVYSDRLNTTVRNCGIRGFMSGIRLAGDAGGMVENNRLDQNTSTGIEIRGDSNVIRGNRIMDTGGTSYGMRLVAGIELSGATATVVEDNIVTNVINFNMVEGIGDAYGILWDSSDTLQIARNTVVNIIPMGSHGLSWGLYSWGGNRMASIRDNTVLNPVLRDGYAIRGAHAGSVCKGNTTHGFTADMNGCIDAGGN